MDRELAQQLPVMKEWLTLAGYTCIECETYEADDILGTLSALCEKSGDECVIATGDRDSLQLISDSTRVLLAATKMGKPEIINYDKAALYEKYGLTPDEMIELKSLMGDSSDNIPGVAGVGEKTATDLISRFHSIDYIYENLDTIDIKDGVRKKLESGKESAYLSRELGTICKTAPINSDISSYKTRPRDTAELSRLMTSLEFFKLMEKMGLTPDSGSLQTALDFSDSKKFSVTEEITPTDTADIYSENGEYYFIFDGKVSKADENTVKNVLADGAVKKRVYDYKTLYKSYPDLDGVVFDAMLAAYLINPSASSYSAERLISEYASPAPEIEGEYDGAFKNACLFSVCCDRLEKELRETNQRKLLDEIEPCDNWFENEGWAFEQSDRLDILCGTQIEDNFSLDDLSLYSDEIANGEPADDLIMDFDDDPEVFDILHHEVPMDREEYKREYGDDYMDEGDIPE